MRTKNHKITGPRNGTTLMLLDPDSVSGSSVVRVKKGTRWTASVKQGMLLSTSQFEQTSHAVFSSFILNNLNKKLVWCSRPVESLVRQRSLTNKGGAMSSTPTTRVGASDGFE